jgi:hypothetical protein
VDESTERFELMTSLQAEGGSTELFKTYVQRLDEALDMALQSAPLVTAYFVVGHEDSREIEVGLRFEGMKPEYIESNAQSILEEAMESLSDLAQAGPTPVREESTLIPA